MDAGGIVSLPWWSLVVLTGSVSLLFGAVVFFLKRGVTHTDTNDAQLQSQATELAVLRTRLEAEKNGHQRGDTQVNNALRDIAQSVSALTREVHENNTRLAAMASRVETVSARLEVVGERAHKSANLGMANEERHRIVDERLARLEGGS